MSHEMLLSTAVWIRALRLLGCTYRKIAELHAAATGDTDTSQHRGRELCIEAARVLNVDVDSFDDASHD